MQCIAFYGQFDSRKSLVHTNCQRTKQINSSKNTVVLIQCFFNIRDFLIYAGHGARPSNYRHNLLLLDPKEKRLIHVPKFAELPQPRYDSLENSITAVYKHGTWFSQKYIWNKHHLTMVETQSCFGGIDTLYRSINIVIGDTKKEVRVDKISFNLAKDDCYGCGPEPWDERFGKYKQ